MLRAAVTALALTAVVSCSEPSATVLDADDVPEASEVVHATGEREGSVGWGWFPGCDDLSLSSQVRLPYDATWMRLPGADGVDSSLGAILGAPFTTPQPPSLEEATAELAGDLELCGEHTTTEVVPLDGLGTEAVGWRVTPRDRDEVWSELAATMVGDRLLIVQVSTAEDELPYSIEDVLALGLAGAERVAGS